MYNLLLPAFNVLCTVLSLLHFQLCSFQTVCPIFLSFSLFSFIPSSLHSNTLDPIKFPWIYILLHIHDINSLFMSPKQNPTAQPMHPQLPLPYYLHLFNVPWGCGRWHRCPVWDTHKYLHKLSSVLSPLQPKEGSLTQVRVALRYVHKHKCLEWTLTSHLFTRHQ